MKLDISGMREMLLLVDEDDNVVGRETKQRCHDGKGLLHRAFMVAIVKEGKLLLTQRSKTKMLWPGFWDGSVSSHVHEGETYEESSRKRLKDELNIECNEMAYLFKFRYQVPYKDRGAEYEICAVLVARFDGEINPNREEISSCKYMNIEELMEDMERSSEKYCPWLKIAFRMMMKEHKEEWEGLLH